MSKKKKSKRHRNFSYSSTGGRAAVAQPRSTQMAEPAPEQVGVPESKPTLVQAIPQDKMAFLKHDLRMIAVLASSAIALEIALWILLQHSAFGQQILGL